MSGGSYDYLGDSVYVSDIYETRVAALRRMTRRLEQLRPDHPATAASQHLLSLLDAEIPLWLLEVWHAVEWADSCDWNDQQRDAVIDQHTDHPPLRLPPLTEGA